MATITLTATTTGGTLTESVTCTDADAQRVLTAYGKILAGTNLGPLPANPTNAQIFHALAATVWAGFKTLVVSTEASTTNPAAPTLT